VAAGDQAAGADTMLEIKRVASVAVRSREAGQQVAFSAGGVFILLLRRVFHG
jgi:hypothetical protein